MPIRTRSQKAKNCFTNGTFSYCDPEYSVLTESINEARVARNRSNIIHVKSVLPYSGRAVPIGRFVNGFSYDFINRHELVGDYFYRNIPDLSNQVDLAFRSMLKSPTENNKFELIPFVADLDKTLAGWFHRIADLGRYTREPISYTRKNFSYGAVTWDVLPFVSDLKALFTSMKDILNGGAGNAQCMPVNRRRVISYNAVHETQNSALYGSFYVSSVVGFAKFNGAYFYTPPNLTKVCDRALFLLDELGVHPDLKTAWDVLPLSFVVDYFIPIGNLLESLHPRGWGPQGFRFEGTSSLKLQVDYRFSYRPDVQRASSDPFGSLTYYERMWNTDTPTPDKPFEWSAPSFQQLFNTAYLAGNFKRFG